MEALTRLVTESLARHGFDRPLDYRRLHWSRWFRCESHHSLLFVPSKPGVFALAEEIVDFGTNSHMASNAHMATGASPVPRTLSEAKGSAPLRNLVSNHDFSSPDAELPSPDAPSPRRLLAVTQFFEDDDMAFVLDRMLSRQNPMAARLTSGRYFVRFVVIEDDSQRRTICTALNQWIANSAEKASGIGSHFATSLELTPATEYVPQPNGAQQSLFADTTDAHVATAASAVTRGEASDPCAEPVFPAPPTSTAPHLDSGAASNIHCPTPLPSGF